jgi:gamma-tubulin complex component 5
MAQTTKINSILSDLVNSFTADSDRKYRRKIKQAKEVAAKNIKAQQYVRTNQFEVEATLNGLIEKFSILNCDDLANALTKRLGELKRVSKSKWTPEILSLFLTLSDRPDLKSTLEALELLKPPSPPPSPVTWAELNAEEPLTGDVWLDESYSSASDDDVETEQKDQSRKTTRFEAATVSEDDVAPNITESITIDSFGRLKSAQFWTQADLRSSRPQLLSELQVIREVLYMLYGLPTSLFAIDEDNMLVYHATNIRLSQISGSGLNDVLQSFASIGSDMLQLRIWARKTQNVPLLQTFTSAICERLRNFDRAVVEIEQRFVGRKTSVIVSILQVHQEIEILARPISALSALATSVPDHGGDFICLELLYEEMCSLQAAGDDECYHMLGQIFFTCLDVYLRPVALWMEEGTILEKDESFFIAVADKASAISSLWHDRYTLRMTNDSTLHAPKFLHPAAKKILNTGKSIVFLQNLKKRTVETAQAQAPGLAYGTVLRDSGMSSLMPFSELFSTAFSAWIGSKYGMASSILKEELFDKCGLLRHFRMLEHIYLSKDGNLFQAFADELFKRMDSRRGDWDDKFLLTELARTIFGASVGIKPNSLGVRTMASSRSARSVKSLDAVLVDVNLTWAIQNIIPRSSMVTYQAVFSLLLQTYRAKYLVRTDNFNLRRLGTTSHRLSIGIQQQLMWFANVMHSYITETVIQTATEELRERLAAAEDVDAMCELHEKFVARLQLASLLAKNLAPIHDSIISILDLAVLYSDAQTSHSDEGRSAKLESTSRGTRQKNTRQRGGRGRRTRTARDNDDADVSSASDSDLSDGEVEMDAGIEVRDQNERPYDEQLQNIRDQFAQHLRFTVAGLRSVSRAGGEPAWEMLAERLEWKQSRSTGYSQ